MNLSLIGFMGTGKSSVGRFAADHLGFTFLDTDEVIEERTGKTISQIFSQHGEPMFRALEKDLLRELGTRTQLVISTGGGLAADSDNLASLKLHSLVVCLWASPEAIWDRVKGQLHRPLLQTPDPLAKIRELLSLRERVYRQADVLVNTEQRSIKEVAQHVIYQLQIARSR